MINMKEIEIENELRRVVRRLFLEKRIDIFIGFEDSLNGVRPCFIKSVDEVDRLVWNKFCKNNLALYLLRFDCRVGIVAKGCDEGAIIELIKENQISRENLYIIGIPCNGIYSEDNKIYSVCKTCTRRNPLIADIIIGELVDEKDMTFDDLKEIEDMPIKDRFRFWIREFENCILCYACRNICPLCYCNECYLDRRDLIDLRERNLSDKIFFHLSRAIHLAGRCIECGECERACPMNIKLGKLFRKISKEVWELFEYKPGIGIEDKNPLITFDPKRDEEL